MFLSQIDTDYDLIIIGGGPGGYSAALRAAQLGDKVLLIEKEKVGGVCLNKGCIPTKTLLKNAEVLNIIKKAERFGISVTDYKINYVQVVARKNEVINKLHLSLENLMKNRGIKIVQGVGRIVGSNQVQIIIGTEDKNVQAKAIIIAVGSSDRIPPITGLDHKDILTSEGALSLSNPPQKFAIIGGGVIGVEMSAYFCEMGSKISIYEMENQLLPGVDEEISRLLTDSFTKRGIQVYTSSTVKEVRSTGKGSFEIIYQINNKQESTIVDAVLVSTGRRANTDGIGLEDVGINTEKGWIKTDESMRTNIKGIYAVGDVRGGYLLAHAAAAEGIIAVEHIHGHENKGQMDIMPATIFTHPEIGCIGLTEKAAKQRGYDIAIGRFPMANIGKALAIDEPEGFAKIIIDKKYGEILGVHLIGAGATEMISEAACAMALEATAEEWGKVIRSHPTLSEVIMEAVGMVTGHSIYK